MVDYSKRKILALYTGGTIGMKPKGKGDDGLVPGDLGKMKENIPELKNLPFQVDFQNFYNKKGVLIDSSDITIEDYNSLAKKIEEEINSYDGVVIIFGTDTMGPSAGYLSYMLEGLNKPVIFAGAMKPVMFPDSDGQKNLIDAINLAGRSGIDIPPLNEVLVVFDGRIIRGTKAYKYSAHEVDAFRSQREDHPGMESDLGKIDGENIDIDQARLIPGLYKDRKFKRHIIPNDIFVGDIIIPPRMPGNFLSEIVKDYSKDTSILFEGLAIQPGSEQERIILENVPKDRPIFYMNEADAPNDRFIKLEGITESQQAMAKIHYLATLTQDQELLRQMCKGSLRGENSNTLINESELLSKSEISKEKNNLFKLK